MRKILISLLLAGAAATPAIAGPHDWSDRQQAREDRQQARDDRQAAAREEHQAAREEHQQAREQLRTERPNTFNPGQLGAVERPGRPAGFEPGFVPRGGAERGDARPDRGNLAGSGVQGHADTYVAPGAHMVRPEFGSDSRAQRLNQRELRQSNRPVPGVIRDRNPLVVSSVPRPGTQPPLRTEARRDIHWDTNWRHDGRHDWRNYRNHHRSLFHLGFYYDPFGWGYQPFSIGWRLWPAYYGRSYWINDPAMFSLPYAPPGCVWVRYFNDALLVDLYTGEVIDAIPGFFW